MAFRFEFPPRPLQDLVNNLGGQIADELKTHEISAISAINTEAPSDVLCPVLRPQYIDAAIKSDCIILCDNSLIQRLPKTRCWVHPNPPVVLAHLLGQTEKAKQKKNDYRHLASVSPDAHIGQATIIGPYCVIEAGVTIGHDCEIAPHTVIHSGVNIGNGVIIGAHCVIGAPGFGWAIGENGITRIPQLGGVIIENNVELGAGCTIDSGTMTPTIIHRSAKLDSQVHVGHNVEIGPYTIIAAQSGFAGSTKIGQGVLVGGQVGIADHCEIGDRAKLAAKSGVIGDVPAGKTYAGYPAIERWRWLRGLAAIFKKPLSAPANNGRPNK